MGKKEISEEEFKKLAQADVDIEGEREENKEKLLTAYRNIIDILKEYLDLREDYYNIIALWIIGTYFHKNFPSYPYLYFNAMKGSGKTRTINLITCLSKDGSVQNSMTEAVLFRTGGTLAIDEFEGVSKKGSENLRELLNSAYKKGVKVKRMRQKKTDEGIRMEVEEFEVYRPIVLANIWGMENVLSDRCISVILEKSSRKEIINLIEIFGEELIVKETTQLLDLVSLVSMSFHLERYSEWNNFIKRNNTNTIYHTNNINNTNNTQAFKAINSMDLNGRELELSLPLCLIANEISDDSGDLLKETTLTLKTIFSQKKQEDLTENYDVSLYDFVSQYEKIEWISMTQICNDFKEFLDTKDEWINNKWLGRALKRLVLIKESKRLGRGRYVILDKEKAIEKIKMFK
ncbi:MAG TPA: hypothetical protein VMX17_11065 [Candidatus Glassbacteria bacterium]|nr:hypothetical protein [Candidatus Glassbacteria bacterium]